MAAICKNHMKKALKQLNAPHVKPSLIGQTCKYCGNDASYIVYYSNKSLFSRKDYYRKNDTLP